MKNEDWLLLGGGALALLYFFGSQKTQGTSIGQSIGQSIGSGAGNVVQGAGYSVGAAIPSILISPFQGAFDWGYGVGGSLAQSVNSFFGW